MLYLISPGSRLFILGALATLPHDAGQRLCEADLWLPGLVVSHSHAHPLFLTGEPKEKTKQSTEIT